VLVAALVLAAVLPLLLAPATFRYASPGRGGPALLTAGVVGDQSRLGSVQALPPEAQGAYVGDSSVVRLRGGQLVLGPVRREFPGLGVAGIDLAERLAEEGSRWLGQGRVPGTTPENAEMARRALLDLRLLTRPNGAVVAGWYPAWQYTWPRDASWAAAAFAATGHDAEARRVLGFLRRLQRADGTWAARYQLDGSGPVKDGRRWQLDANGWVPWAVWFGYRHAPPAAPGGGAPRGWLADFWPMVAAAADGAARSLGPDGLPPAGPDYWETRTDEVTIGTAAPLLTGLRAAADIAVTLGHGAEARRWSAAANRLDDAVRARFRPHRYPRTPDPLGGADAAVTFLAPPFAPYDAGVEIAVNIAAGELTLPGGGMLPGQAWTGDRTMTWTPQTAFFALAAAATGDRPGARRRLDWLGEHRTPFGALPEKVDELGRPASVAPLAWTCSIVLLALTALERTLPVPPVTGPAPPGTGAARPGDGPS
jgi:hypothetical protein